MCTTDISMCNRHMWVTTAHYQNKSYLQSIRQYAKRSTKAILPSAYLHIKITKYHQKIILHLGGMSRGCHLIVQCQEHAKISCGKV